MFGFLFTLFFSSNCRTFNGIWLLPTHFHDSHTFFVLLCAVFLSAVVVDLCVCVCVCPAAIVISITTTTIIIQPCFPSACVDHMTRPFALIKCFSSIPFDLKPNQVAAPFSSSKNDVVHSTNQPPTHPR